MENAIPSLLIGAVLLLASALLTHSTIHSYSQIGDSMKQMQTRMNEQVRTHLKIHDATMPNANTLALSLDDDGQTQIADFDRLDVIVSYVTTGGNPRTVWLPFSDDVSPPPDSWSIAGISRDAFEPGILNPGETAQIEVHLADGVKAAETNLITINSASGSPASAQFSR